MPQPLPRTHRLKLQAQDAAKIDRIVGEAVDTEPSGSAGATAGGDGRRLSGIPIGRGDERCGVRHRPAASVVGEGTQPGPLDARAARGVLLLPHAGRKRRDDGAEECRTRIGREQLDAGWRRVEVSWPASVCLASVASDGD